MPSKLSLFLAELKRRKLYFVAIVFGLLVGCRPAENSPLTADVPLHLEEHVDAATIIGSEVRADLLEPVEWRFDETQPDWRVMGPSRNNPELRPADVSQNDEALRIVLGPSNANRGGRIVGGVHVDVPEWDHRDWGHVIIRAQSTGPGTIGPIFNSLDLEGPHPPNPTRGGEPARLVGDNTVQTYQIRIDPPESWDERIERLGIWVTDVSGPTTVKLLSVSVVPVDALYADDRTRVREITVGDRIRRTLYTHAPGRLEYQVRVPEGGRFDVGLGVLWRDPPVKFRVEAQPQGGEAVTLLEESYGDTESWGQRSVDLAEYAGRTITLALETDAEREGTVAFWGAPTVSGSTRVAKKPNVIFYIIDGAGAEYMSVYGYNRRTTPNIERLAAEGAVFERAYSNATWTRPSNASFMTSLLHSVLGGFKGGLNVVPENALTMAQRMHAGGYQTAVFTPNPNAGKLSGLERGVDFHREAWPEMEATGRMRESSKYLHDAFWSWREAYPGEPYWVHFQSMDLAVHSRSAEDFRAVAPFGGLFVGPDQLTTWEQWLDVGVGNGVWPPYSRFWEEDDPNRLGFFTTAQAMYAETMAHNDYQLGRLVERLKATGEWENTLLIVAADHSIGAAMEDMAIAIQDSLPPRWEGAMFRPSITRIPLLFVWPGHIAGGQRFSQPVVSMIDALPTILDLVGLPLPEVMQGQSLAPLLLGEGSVEPRPVILDEFEVDRETGEFRGTIEVVDGRWGASLEINPNPEVPEDEQRPIPLLLYDLWNDPRCLHSLHEERPELVEKYTAFLEAQFEAHLALGKLFTPSEPVPLTPEQLEMLRALGYIR